MARFIPEEWAIHFPANNEFHLNSILRDVFQPSMQADAGRWYVAIRLGAIIQLGVSLPTKNKQLKALSAVDPYEPDNARKEPRRLKRGGASMDLLLGSICCVG